MRDYMMLPKYTESQLALVLQAVQAELNNPHKVVVLVGTDYNDATVLNKLYVEITSVGYRRASKMLFRHQRDNRLRRNIYLFVNYPDVTPSVKSEK